MPAAVRSTPSVAAVISGEMPSPFSMQRWIGEVLEEGMGYSNYVPGAAQHAMMRCRPGIAKAAGACAVPHLRCTAKKRCIACGTRVQFPAFALSTNLLVCVFDRSIVLPCTFGSNACSTFRAVSAAPGMNFPSGE